jgi:hypothetical protein
MKRVDGESWANVPHLSLLFCQRLPGATRPQVLRSRYNAMINLLRTPRGPCAKHMPGLALQFSEQCANDSGPLPQVKSHG